MPNLSDHLIMSTPDTLNAGVQRWPSEARPSTGTPCWALLQIPPYVVICLIPKLDLAAFFKGSPDVVVVFVPELNFPVVFQLTPVVFVVVIPQLNSPAFLQFAKYVVILLIPTVQFSESCQSPL